MYSSGSHRSRRSSGPSSVRSKRRNTTSSFPHLSIGVKKGQLLLAGRRIGKGVACILLRMTSATVIGPVPTIAHAISIMMRRCNTMPRYRRVNFVESTPSSPPHQTHRLCSAHQTALRRDSDKSNISDNVDNGGLSSSLQILYHTSNIPFIDNYRYCRFFFNIVFPKGFSISDVMNITILVATASLSTQFGILAADHFSTLLARLHEILPLMTSGTSNGFSGKQAFISLLFPTITSILSSTAATIADFCLLKPFKERVERKMRKGVTDYIDRRYIRDGPTSRALMYGPAYLVADTHQEVRDWASSMSSAVVNVIRAVTGCLVLIIESSSRCGSGIVARHVLLIKICYIIFRLCHSYLPSLVGRSHLLSSCIYSYTWASKVIYLVYSGVAIAATRGIPATGLVAYMRMLFMKAPSSLVTEDFNVRHGSAAVDNIRRAYQLAILISNLYSFRAGTHESLERILPYTTLQTKDLYNTESKYNDIRKRVSKGDYTGLRGTVVRSMPSSWITQNSPRNTTDNKKIEVISIAILRNPLARNSEALINRLSFTISQGSNLLIIGPEGSGKTSLMRLIGEYYPLAEGTIIKPQQHGDATPSSCSSIIENGVGKDDGIIYLPKVSVYPDLTLKQHLTYPNIAMPCKKSENELLQCLDKVGLGNLIYDLASVGDEDGVKEDDNGDSNRREKNYYRHRSSDILSWDSKMSHILYNKKAKVLKTPAELQKLALARLHYHSSDFAFLDGATNELTEKEEFHNLIACEKANITVVATARLPVSSFSQAEATFFSPPAVNEAPRLDEDTCANIVSSSIFRNASFFDNVLFLDGKGSYVFGSIEKHHSLSNSSNEEDKLSDSMSITNISGNRQKLFKIARVIHSSTPYYANFTDITPRALVRETDVGSMKAMP